MSKYWLTSFFGYTSSKLFWLDAYNFSSFPWCELYLSFSSDASGVSTLFISATSDCYRILVLGAVASFGGYNLRLVGGFSGYLAVGSLTCFTFPWQQPIIVKSY